MEIELKQVIREYMMINKQKQMTYKTKLMHFRKSSKRVRRKKSKRKTKLKFQRKNAGSQQKY